MQKNNKRASNIYFAHFTSKCTHYYGNMSRCDVAQINVMKHRPIRLYLTDMLNKYVITAR